MKLGIIGKPQSGKTTIFNAASGQQEAVGDFSKAVHRAIIKVPDHRVDVLTEIVRPRKFTYAEIEFLDVTGLSGKGKDSTAFEPNPEFDLMEAFIVVIDAFSEDANPENDLQDLIDEMILSDQVMIENNIQKRSRKIKLSGDKSGVREIELLQKCMNHLEAEKPLLEFELEHEEEKLLRGYSFLSRRPLLILINIAEDKLAERDAIEKKFAHLVAPGRREVVVVCGKIQMELAGLEPDEQKQFLDELGIDTPAVDKVIQKSYSLLGLISFLTLGDPEVRAWTIKSGTNAQKAAGAIHTDIERGFIRAEVATFEDYSELKSLPALKAAGKSRLEGKDYVVQDGDVILFRFNV